MTKTKSGTMRRWLCAPCQPAGQVLADPSAPRTILVHHHLYKHAGSTVDGALARNFGGRFVSDATERGLHEQGEGFVRALQRHEGVMACSSHSLRFPLPDLPQTRLVPLVILRHPIERIFSVYNWERNRQAATGRKFQVCARENELGDFVRACLQFDMVPAIRNYHISQMLPAPVYWKKAFDETHLARAKSHLAAIELTGFVEKFDESMVLFEEKLRPLMPKLDLSYTSRNVAPGKRLSQAGRLDWFASELGAELFATLNEANRLDLELYEGALSRFEERLAAIPALGAKLSDFKARCRRHGDMESSFLYRVKRKICKKTGCLQ